MMNATVKISGIRFAELQNGEHFEFASEVDKLIVKFGAENLDIAKEYPAFKTAFEDEDRSFKITQKSALTKTIEEADKNRDDVFSGIRSEVKAKLKHFDAATAEAAYRLQILLDGYGNLSKMSYDKESAGIKNLLQDLDGEKYIADVDLLSLSDWVRKLDAYNTEFEAVMTQRYDEQSDKNALSRLRAARLQTDSAYTAIRDKINAGVVFFGAEKYEPFVRELNARIDRYNNAMATRKGRNATKND